MVLSPIGLQFTEQNKCDNPKSLSGTRVETKWTIEKASDGLSRQRVEDSLNQGVFMESRNDLMAPR